MHICNDEPDIILITEAIPKAQKLSIASAQLHVPDYTLYANFTPSSENLGASGLRGVCIYAKNYLRVSQVYPVSEVVSWSKFTTNFLANDRTNFLDVHTNISSIANQGTSCTSRERQGTSYTHYVL